MRTGGNVKYTHTYKEMLEYLYSRPYLSKYKRQILPNYARVDKDTYVWDMYAGYSKNIDGVEYYNIKEVRDYIIKKSPRPKCLCCNQTIYIKHYDTVTGKTIEVRQANDFEVFSVDGWDIYNHNYPRVCLKCVADMKKRIKSILKLDEKPNIWKLDKDELELYWTAYMAWVLKREVRKLKNK